MPIANASLKADYAAYCAEQRARHYTPISYELWLEGTVNALQLDLANAKRALHLPDSYRAALEKLDGLLEASVERLKDKIDSYENWSSYPDYALLMIFTIKKAMESDVAARELIAMAMGAADQVTDADNMVGGSEEKA